MTSCTWVGSEISSFTNTGIRADISISTRDRASVFSTRAASTSPSSAIGRLHLLWDCELVNAFSKLNGVPVNLWAARLLNNQPAEVADVLSTRSQIEALTAILIRSGDDQHGYEISIQRRRPAHCRLQGSGRRLRVPLDRNHYPNALSRGLRRFEWNCEVEVYGQSDLLSLFGSKRHF